ncbi:MAG: glycosyltransferase family 2 protein [Prolixibacteraceae bacterium]|nr:glycosyltransferase family 2 protein [Prolixibacteraceae bacterium]
MSIIHYYSVCWNEEKILPFVLDYYSKFCDKMVVMDNESDDNSPAIINSYPNVELRSYSSNGEFRDDINLEIKNNLWKESRGKADWVIVCDTDEILYHSQLIAKLDELKSIGISIIRPHGFDMYAESYPQKSLLEITNGIKDNRLLGKCIIFNPNLIEEMNYRTGCHKCYPTGHVRFYKKDDIKLLHYKCMELEFLIERFDILRKRLSNYNIVNKFGKHYLIEKELIRKNYLINLSNATNVFQPAPEGILGVIYDYFRPRRL